MSNNTFNEKTYSHLYLFVVLTKRILLKVHNIYTNIYIALCIIIYLSLDVGVLCFTHSAALPNAAVDYICSLNCCIAGPV